MRSPNEGNSNGANGLRYSYGAGLEWISPIGPLKLSLGFPVVKHATDKYQKFQFQIGTSF
jgi:outer membrane protein insertion porin family